MRRTNGNGKIRRELMAAALSAAALAMSSAPALAAVDTFLKIGDIKGESTDLKFKGSIDVLSWSWGMVGAGRNSPKPQQPVGPAQAACAFDISFVKKTDHASPQLMAAVATGTHFPEATVIMRTTSGAEKESFLTVTLKDVVISSVSQGASGGQDAPTENVGFAFSGGSVSFVSDGDNGPVTASIPPSCK